MSLNERIINIAPEPMTIGMYDGVELGRSEWPSGPWDAEGFDWGTWSDAESGLRCAIKRNHSGSWCGYVVIPTNPPINERTPESEEEEDYVADLTAGNPVWLDVHGGVTFHGFWSLKEADLSGWAVGFDCSHSGDTSPRYTALHSGEYRDFLYVVAEVRSLAKQLAEYEPLKQLVSGTNANEESQ
jgi:hypothetical protein